MTAQHRLRTLDQKVLGAHAAPPREQASKAAYRNLAIGVALLVGAVAIRLSHPLPPLEVGLGLAGILLVGASVARVRRNRG